jgi:hypothetical protein
MQCVSRVAAEESHLTIKGVLYPSPRNRWPSPCSELIMPWEKKSQKGEGGYGSEVNKHCGPISNSYLHFQRTFQTQQHAYH